MEGRGVEVCCNFFIVTTDHIKTEIYIVQAKNRTFVTEDLSHFFKSIFSQLCVGFKA